MSKPTLKDITHINDEIAAHMEKAQGSESRVALHLLFNILEYVPQSEWPDMLAEFMRNAMKALKEG